LRTTGALTFRNRICWAAQDFNCFVSPSINVKRDVATRLQIPLKLGYAFTVHKAQGLTLDCVEVDCRNINFPGQLGVAVGRAMKTDGLRVINSSIGNSAGSSSKLSESDQFSTTPDKNSMSRFTAMA
jgi:hypothetical protein